MSETEVFVLNRPSAPVGAIRYDVSQEEPEPPTDPLDQPEENPLASTQDDREQAQKNIGLYAVVLRSDKDQVEGDDGVGDE